MGEIAEAGGSPRLRVKNRRRIRNYLMNLRYQLRYTLTIVGTSVVLTSLLGYLSVSKAREATRVVQVRTLDATDVLAHGLLLELRRSDQIMVMSLVGFGVLISLGLSLHGIVSTHKVAGPLYKVTMYLRRIREGRLGQLGSLRKGDQLLDFFEHFRSAHQALRLRTQEDIALLDRAIAALGATPLAEELRLARQRKAASLE